MAKPKLGSGTKFKALVNKLDNNPAVDNPKALAASIGRKKLGKDKFQKLAKNGKKDIADGMDASVKMEHPAMSAGKKAMMKK